MLTPMSKIFVAKKDSPEMKHDDPARQVLSRIFGRIEEGINQAKVAIEDEGFAPRTRALLFAKLDEVQDHVTEVFRHVVDGDEMKRWVRRVDMTDGREDEATMDGPLDHVMAV